ncbi:uncharacterized protein N7459_004078 [Penicillium hispanicum]|uniref:uncharacterized protein n=1 Tax=Penicillium hispanicum TaxID=1080232 RepID=UPI0025425296|nr:uncharacterized protein N7459_004078 [Penicillium hispanicum]KAJ5584278.1 hypothetical protein N7459_004078 [Penicillium hispanicum]
MLNDPIPPSRRKSCEACKTAKRRCDLAIPICSRCAQRNVSCIYPGRQTPGAADFYLASSQMDVADTWAPFRTNPPYTDVYDLYAPPDATDPMESLLEYNQHEPGNPWLEYNPDIHLPTTFEVARPRSRQLEPLSEVFASRLQFSIDILKESPRMMVLENQTPWCHRHLYKRHMPKVMQDAYACCSLYISKNEVNATVIMSLIDSHTTNLLSTPEPTSHFDLLAHTHALLLHLIMRLFDGNIRSQAMADSLFIQLESSVLALLGCLHLPDPSQPADLLPSSMDSTIDFWDSWVKQESARRTVLLTYYFVQVYKLLQGHIPLACDGRLGLDHAWYLSAHLWNAPSAFDFAVAWAEKQHHIIDNLDFSWVLQTAQPADMDMFGRMILITLLGIDEVKAWFHARGAAL